MQAFRLNGALPALFIILVLSGTPVWGQADAEKSGYDFQQLSSMISGDQVDYFSGDWSYSIPLVTVQGAGGMSLPLRLVYSSAITGVDRLTKLTQSQPGNYTINNASWVGLGWNLNVGAITVTGGYDLQTTSGFSNHPLSYDMSMVVADGSYRLVRQLNAGNQPTNRFFTERHSYRDIVWNYDNNTPLTSTWTVRDLSGTQYTFGAVSIDSVTYGMNLTMRAARIIDASWPPQEGLDYFSPEFVYQWKLAEILDPQGNAIRFTYTAEYDTTAGEYRTLTTFRSTAYELGAPWRRFDNYLENEDLDPRMTNSPISVEVIKTQKTSHLSGVRFYSASGKLVRTIETQTSERWDLPLSWAHADDPNLVSIENLHFNNASQLSNPLMFRSVDGLDTFHRLDALTVKDGSGKQLSRVTFQYKPWTKRPPIAPGDSICTMLLDQVAIEGTGGNWALPAFTFEYSESDSYRLSRIITPTGATLDVDYGAYPDLGLIENIKIHPAFYDRSRRIIRRTWDADGSGPALPDTTTYEYPTIDQWFPAAGSILLERVTHPQIRERLPGGQGAIRRDFVSLDDLTWLSPYDIKEEAERRIWRGLLKSTTYLNSSHQVIRTETPSWLVSSAGSWLGQWYPYYYPGMPQQAFWVRQDTTTVTLDGVANWTGYEYNDNGLVATQTEGYFENGGLQPRSYRVTETIYHGDEVTAASPLAITWNPPTVDLNNDANDYTNPASTYNYVQAFRAPDVIGDSEIQVTYTTQSWSVSYPAYRISGVVGIENPQGTNLFSSAEVCVVWSVGGTQNLVLSTHTVPAEGPTLSDSQLYYNEIALVPEGATSGYVQIILRSEVRKPAQSVYRSITTYTDDLMVQGMTIGVDQTDVLLLEAHILDRPHVVSVKDPAGTLLQQTTTRYGQFGGLLMPDTTYAWEDRNGDMLVDAAEQVIQQRVLSYDVVGNPIEVADAAGTITSSVWRYNQMVPAGAFVNADASRVSAFVFDDYTDWSAMQADGWWDIPWGHGAITLIDGVMMISGPVGQWEAAVYNLTPHDAGVLECDAMIDVSSGDTGYIIVYGTNNNQSVGVRFGADGTFNVLYGWNYYSIGVQYEANRWYRIRMEWNRNAGTYGQWFVSIDGVRYPSTGYYACGPGRSTPTDRIAFFSNPGASSLYIDNVRTYPVTAQPGSMTTCDPGTLGITGITDANGMTRRFMRDGLNRLVLTRNSEGRVVGQRGSYFSRGRGFSDPYPYHPETPNRGEAIVYTTPYAHRDLTQSGDRTISPGPEEEEGATLTTTPDYVVASDSTVTFRANTRITLTDGFHARPDADFRATLDPTAGAGLTSSTGTVTWNALQGIERGVEIAAAAILTAGTVSGHSSARVDAYIDAATTGTSTLLSLDDGTDYVAAKYHSLTANFTLEVRQSGVTTTPEWTGAYPILPLDTWNNVELEMTPDGAVHVWMYPRGWPRWKGLSATVTGFTDGWNPRVIARGGTGTFTLTNLYSGPAETALTYYDGLARPFQSRLRTGVTDVATQTVYNRVSLPDSVRGPIDLPSSYAYDALTASAAGSKVMKTTYWADPLGRTRQVIPPGHEEADAVKVRYGKENGYTGSMPWRWTTTADEKGILTTQYTNPFGRIVQSVADSGGTDQATAGATTSFSYDELDRLRFSKAPEGDRTCYFYNTLGRVTKKLMPDVDDTTRYKYDDLGRLRFSRDARQAALPSPTVTYSVYDAFGRVTRIGEKDTTFAALDPNTTYDFESDATSWKTRNYYDVDYVGRENYARGRVTKVEENTDMDPAAEVTILFAYDREGRVWQQRVIIDGLPARTVQYAYDLAGRVMRVMYPDSSEARYAYDTAGRLVRVTDAGGNPYAVYTYTPAGNIATHTVGDTLVVGAYAYTLRDRVNKIRYGATFLDTLTYDPVGNVTQQVYRHGTGSLLTADYGYDALQRLKNFTHTTGDSRDWTYDRNGNIETRVTDGHTLTYYYDSTANRLTGTSDGIDYLYNARGWMTDHGSKTLEYDYRGLVTGYSDPSKNYTYIIDSAGKRVKKSGESQTVYYIRGVDGSVLAEYDGNHQLDRMYVFAGSHRIAYIKNDTTTYYLTDHLGNTRVVLTEHGTIPAAYDYYPHGEMLASTGETTQYKFTGHERDDESEFDYMLARMYDPKLGRFLKQDTQDYPAWSPYVYSFANPMRFVDPDGQSGIDVVEKALEYRYTPYEFGGWNPVVIGGRYTGLPYWLFHTMVGGSSILGGAVNNYIYTYIREEYNFPFGNTLGVDCSRLAMIAFNADPDKLMPDFNLMMTNVATLREKFQNSDFAEVSRDWANAQEGDLLLKEKHVQIVVRYDKKNNQLVVIDAPGTGGVVDYRYEKIEALDEDEKAFLGRSKRREYPPRLLFEATSDRTRTRDRDDPSSTYNAEYQAPPY